MDMTTGFEGFGQANMLLFLIYRKVELKMAEANQEVKLPKNIRQVGNPSGGKKVYIEDYVVTYLSGLALPSNSYSRGAILVGTVKQTQEGSIIFISGAVEAQNLELDLDETVFTSETWAGIYENIHQYFPDLEVVGWFLSRLGFSVSLNDKIIKTHVEHFSGPNKLLYMIDSFEGEDAFYLFENGSLKRQRGYYIYYEKNEAMQSYMIDKKKENRPKKAENPKIIKKDEELIRSYRSTLAQKKPEKGSGFFYVASTCLTIAILAVGITVINNYDKMRLLEATVNEMAEEIKGNNTNQIVDIAKNEGTTVPERKDPDVKEALSQSGTTAATTTAGSEDTTEKEEEKTTAKSPDVPKEKKKKVEEATTEAKSKVSTPAASKSATSYYRVKEGDTLIGISKKMYHSSNYVDVLLKANKMSVDDIILPGQKIIIPAVN